MLPQGEMTLPTNQREVWFIFRYPTIVNTDRAVQFTRKILSQLQPVGNVEYRYIVANFSGQTIILLAFW